jgi:hypothetical protein
MGLTMPLDRDVLVSPVPVGSMVGSIRVEGADSSPPRLVRHRVSERPDGLGVAVELELCEGSVTQHSAFLSLPDGRSVYLEERLANRPLSIAAATSGNVALYDDTRGPYQENERSYVSGNGPVTPHPDLVHPGNWLNVDDRLGYIALGAAGFTLRLADDYLRSPFGKQYRLGLLGFMPQMNEHPRRGERISVFALATCPHQPSDATRALAEHGSAMAWAQQEDGLLALRIGERVVYADFGVRAQEVTESETDVAAVPGACGWRDLS